MAAVRRAAPVLSDHGEQQRHQGQAEVEVVMVFHCCVPMMLPSPAMATLPACHFMLVLVITWVSLGWSLPPAAAWRPNYRPLWCLFVGEAPKCLDDSQMRRGAKTRLTLTHMLMRLVAS